MILFVCSFIYFSNEMKSCSLKVMITKYFTFQSSTNFVICSILFSLVLITVGFVHAREHFTQNQAHSRGKQWKFSVICYSLRFCSLFCPRKSLDKWVNDLMIYHSKLRINHQLQLKSMSSFEKKPNLFIVKLNFTKLKWRNLKSQLAFMQFEVDTPISILFMNWD